MKRDASLEEAINQIKIMYEKAVVVKWRQIQAETVVHWGVTYLFSTGASKLFFISSARRINSSVFFLSMSFCFSFFSTTKQTGGQPLMCGMKPMADNRNSEVPEFQVLPIASLGLRIGVVLG